jgi:phosphoribosyl 1,2-cyclic phosphodiesterase
VEFEFWGCRGSIAAAGARTSRYGGNTTCLEVNTRDGTLIIDAGTGIRALGAKLAADGPRMIRVLFTHVHWDHIQGLPMFAPIFDPSFEIELISCAEIIGSGVLEETLRGQMQAPNFPVPWDYCPSTRRFRELAVNGVLELPNTRVLYCALDHPNGIVAYRIESGGQSVVFATDVEHPEQGADPRLVAFARGADALIYDAQYTTEEYAERVGFGHSTWEVGIETANKAGVDRLFLTHHDPGHDDLFLDEIAGQAAAKRAGTVLAREGLRIALGGTS